MIFHVLQQDFWNSCTWHVAQLDIFLSFVLNSTTSTHTSVYSSVLDFLPGLTKAIQLWCLLFVFCSWICAHWHHTPIYSGCCGNGIGFRNDVSLTRMQEEAQQVTFRTLFQVMLLKFFASSDKLCDEGAVLHNVLCCSYDGFHCVARKPLSSTQRRLMRYVFLGTVCLSRRKLCCHCVSRF